MPKLTDKAWSPYLAGVLIGLLQIPAFLLLNTALGASSSYVTVAGTIGALFDPTLPQIDYVAKHLTGPKNWWQVALVGGIALGAALSAWAGGTVRRAVSPIWRRAIGTDALATRAALGFAGGFLLLVGARIADGCTSGHGISGLAQLSVGSTIAVASMFAGGILTAVLLRRV